MSDYRSKLRRLKRAWDADEDGWKTLAIMIGVALVLWVLLQ